MRGPIVRWKGPPPSPPGHCLLALPQSALINKGTREEIIGSRRYNRGYGESRWGSGKYWLERWRYTKKLVVWVILKIHLFCGSLFNMAEAKRSLSTKRTSEGFSSFSFFNIIFPHLRVFDGSQKISVISLTRFSNIFLQMISHLITMMLDLIPLRLLNFRKYS